MKTRTDRHGNSSITPPPTLVYSRWGGGWGGANTLLQYFKSRERIWREKLPQHVITVPDLTNPVSIVGLLNKLYRGLCPTAGTTRLAV